MKSYIAHVSSRGLFRALNMMQLNLLNGYPLEIKFIIIIIIIIIIININIKSNLARPVIIQTPTHSPVRYTAELYNVYNLSYYHIVILLVSNFTTKTQCRPYGHCKGKKNPDIQKKNWVKLTPPTLPRIHFFKPMFDTIVLVFQFSILFSSFICWTIIMDLEISGGHLVFYFGNDLSTIRMTLDHPNNTINVFFRQNHTH